MKNIHATGDQEHVPLWWIQYSSSKSNKCHNQKKGPDPLPVLWDGNFTRKGSKGSYANTVMHYRRN